MTGKVLSTWILLVAYVYRERNVKLVDRELFKALERLREAGVKDIPPIYSGVDASVEPDILEVIKELSQSGALIIDGDVYSRFTVEGVSQSLEKDLETYLHMLRYSNRSLYQLLMKLPVKQGIERFSGYSL